jgi:sodium/proline symporter
VTVIVWSLLSTPPIGADGIKLAQSEAIIPFSLYELVPGFFFSMLAIFLFSKIGPSPSKEMIEEFDLVKASNI